MSRNVSMNELDSAEFRRFGTLVSWAAALCFGLISLGSLVRASHSGLSCPDWPLCYGKAVPTFNVHIFLEWFHRLIAGSLAVLMLLISYKLSRSPQLRRVFGPQIAASVCLLLVQIVLGGLTVLKLLDPATVSSHLLNALLFFTVLIWVAMRARRLEVPFRATRPVPKLVTGLFTASTVLIFLQVAVGGSVSSRFAGLACSDFPTCGGSWAIPNNLPQALQMIHRELAFALLAFVAILSFLSSRVQLPKEARRAIRLVPVLVVVQILLGVINIYFALPVWASAAHLANATAIYTLSLMATIALLAQRKGYDYRATTGNHGTSDVRSAHSVGLAELPSPN